MKNETKDRVVVITGASSGIGRATALRFADGGARLVLAARREDALEEVADECERRGVQAIAVECDVSDYDEVRDLGRAAKKKFGRIDVWVNNAAVATVGRFDKVPIDEHEQVIRTNVLGVIYGCHVALQHFHKNGHGVLINVSSVAGKGSHPYVATYAASKHAVTGLGMGLRQELWLDGKKKIHVCSVHPESVDTPFFQHAANHIGRQFKPMPPILNPEAVAERIYEVAIRPRDEVFVGAMGRIVAGQGKIARGLTEKQMAFMTRHTMLGERTPETAGNVFHPTKQGRGIHGGWKENGGGMGVRSLAGIAAGVAGAYLLWRRSASTSREPLDRAA